MDIKKHSNRVGGTKNDEFNARVWELWQENKVT